MWSLKTVRDSRMSRRPFQVLMLKWLMGRLQRLRVIARQLVISWNIEDYRLLNVHLTHLRMCLLRLKTVTLTPLRVSIWGYSSAIKRIYLALKFRIRDKWFLWSMDMWSNKMRERCLCQKPGRCIHEEFEQMARRI
ncbi:hypothetical protein CDAR_305271 [Caerostris darwini]|uniref:Uncharacterized protein n=1 Tax=Caerostris darwini TaxID=1538125 RepID=A0AAV4MBE0_9ARAC|nr:hypothetical protein CDAR_305271 [Caerostris darwini]